MVDEMRRARSSPATGWLDPRASTLSRASAADPLQVQRAIIYQTTISSRADLSWPGLFHGRPVQGASRHTPMRRAFLAQ